MHQFLQRTQETPLTCSERPGKAKPSLPLSFPSMSLTAETNGTGRKKVKPRVKGKTGSGRERKWVVRRQTPGWVQTADWDGGWSYFSTLCFLTVAWLFSGNKVSPSLSLVLIPKIYLQFNSDLYFCTEKLPFFHSQTAQDFCARMAAAASPLLQHMHSRVTINYQLALSSWGDPVPLKRPYFFQPYNIPENVEILRIRVWKQSDKAILNDWE